MSKCKKNYKRKNQFKNYTKAKVKKVKNLKNPEFTFRVEIVSLDDYKNRYLLDSYSYNEWLKDNYGYEGGDDDE